MNWKIKTVMLAGIAGSALSAVAASEGFTSLFNGTDLTGWWGLKTENPAAWMGLPAEELAAKKASSLADVKAHWRVEDGTLVNDGKGLYLTTEENFADFELCLEYKTVKGADSGIYLRGIPQVQIWDTTDETKFSIGANKGSGGLWNNPKGTEGKDPLVLADQPFGEWNSVRVVMVGELVTVYLNDRLVVDHARMSNYFKRDMPIPRSGPIQLQTHGGEISWRNIQIRSIGGEEANWILAAKSWQDGHAVAKWIGDAHNYTFNNGEIQCLKGKGGTVFSEKEYGDFAVKFQFKLPPAGNNGLAIRFPGKGNPAYDGMTELQVLDNTAKCYSKLDARQYHGSIYGMVPAHRGYLRPVGEWNFETVEVVGSTIKVVLNGTQILDGDVANIENFKSNTKHPGKDLKRGHFGFAGHSDPVVFRNLLIKELDHESK